MYETVVVGGAAAGLTAALYSARQGLKTLVITKDIGGQAVLTPHIENYPGIRSIGGLELMQIIEEQAKDFGAEIVYDEVIKLQPSENLFQVSTRTMDYETLTVILAFGKTPKDMGVPGEERFVGKGISYCAVCDAPLFRNKKVAVVGWGDPALEAALILCRYGNKVYVVHKSSKLVANEDLLDECFKNNVETIPNSTVKEVKGTNRLETLVIKDVKNGGERELKVEGVFVELGYIPKTNWVKGLVQLNDKGEIIVDKFCKTSYPGIFAAGDVTDTPYKQAVISAGQGAIAALSAYNYIQQIRGRPTVRSDWRVLKKAI